MSKSSKHKKINFEKKITENGDLNTKYVDLLDEDKPIAGQHYVCLSFVSPEKILKKKEIFYFNKFLKNWDLNKSMEIFVNFLKFISYKYKLSFDDLYNNFKDFVDEEKNSFTMSNLKDSYDTFIEQNEDELEKEFNRIYNFKTSIRGIKIRGSFSSIEEAELRSKMLREIDPHHDIFVGQVGLWLPWDPDVNKTERVEYSEELLNQLMHEKKKNEEKAKIEFETRKKESKEKAIKENIINAEKSNNKLTQTIDSDGNLIGLSNTQEKNLISKDYISTRDIQKELFEGDNIITGKTDNGKSKLISGPFANKKIY